MKPINVLSLFDGMSCGRQALERAGISVNLYLASEIDKYAIKITMKNYPDTVQLGDVRGVDTVGMPKIDLLLAGSPCQGFSFAGKQLAFDDPRSVLFFEFVRILKEFKEKNPKIKFLLENVKMKKVYQDIISEILGVEPIEINSALVSAQNRKRLYWTNIEGVEQPEDRGILLKDIVLPDVLPIELDGLRGKNGCFGEGYARVFTDKSTTLRTPSGGGNIPSFIKRESAGGVVDKVVYKHTYMSTTTTERFIKYGMNFVDRNTPKARCLCAEEYVKNGRQGNYVLVSTEPIKIRKFHPIECERLQTVKDNYTDGVSNTARYRMLGNGWTIDVIARILRNIK